MTTYCVFCGFTNSTVPATGPRGAHGFVSLATPRFLDPPCYSRACVLHSLAWRHLARHAERSTPNAAQRLRRRRKGLTANGGPRATMLQAMMDLAFRRSDRSIGPS